MSDAVLSADGAHRYRLTRSWPAITECPSGGIGCLLFVMLNPSTADASSDDPTIRKCRGFATRYGYASLEVVNLFSFRATKPKDLWAAYVRNTPESDAHIEEAARAARTIVVAWGAQPKAMDRAASVSRRLRGIHADLHTIGDITPSGHPPHPLMLEYARQLKPWPGYRPEQFA